MPHEYLSWLRPFGPWLNTVGVARCVGFGTHENRHGSSIIYDRRLTDADAAHHDLDLVASGDEVVFSIKL